MKNILRKILFGNTPVSEYSTITVKDVIKEIVYLGAGSKRVDISANQWLLCLDPVVFGIWFTKENTVIAFEKKRGYKMYFTDSQKDNNTVAVITLEYFNKIEEKEGTLYLLRLVNTKINHINFIKTCLLFHRYYKKPGWPAGFRGIGEVKTIGAAGQCNCY